MKPRNNPETKTKLSLTLLLPSLLFLQSCTNQKLWFPLEINKEWTYIVHAPFGGRVYKAKVVGKNRVGVMEGYKISGIGGELLAAWSGNELVASQISGVRFHQPITLLKPYTEHTTWTYKGMCTNRSIPTEANLQMVQKPEILKSPSAEKQTLKVTLTGTIGSTPIELITWFAKGKGIIRQEQRENGKLMVWLELIEIH